MPKKLLRDKKLNCLYTISTLVSRPDITIEKMLAEAVNAIPQGYQYPEITCTRITFHKLTFKTKNFRATPWKQAADITIDSKRIGAVEVYYLEPRPESDEGPFLKEERDQLNDIARQLGVGIKRRQAEEALQESEEKYRALVENAPNMVVVYQDGHFKYVNRAACNRLGWTYEELTSPSFGVVEKLVSEGYQHIVRENIAKRLRGEYVPPYEITLKTQDGSEFPVLVRGATISYGGKPANQVVFSDLTERIEAEKKARELQLLKEVDNLRHQLLSNVSHELRTPLTSIKGFVSTLLRPDAKWSEEEQRDFLETINQEADRLTLLINDLLDMSRIDAGALKLDKDYYHISEILESIGIRLAILTQYHRLDIKVPPELPRVFVDKMRIGQVLTNMVDNATKYSSGGSEITIEARLDKNEIIVSVADKGQGIPAELLDKVFDRFYQAENIVTGRKRGTGLGLSICRGIVQAHNGRLWVESKLGEGSKFSFSLPVTKGEGQVAQDSSH